MRHCPIGNCSIFLDLTRDRYFLLQADAQEKFQRFLAGQADSEDLSWLVSHRIICVVEEEASERGLETQAPSSSIIDDGLPSASIGLTANAIIAQLTSARILRRRPLADVLSQIALPPGPNESADYERAVKAAAAFQRARYFVPGVDKCLVRSVAMKGMLAHQGCHVSLVIGVSLPFSAHAWIQLGSVVLTDPFDLITNYTPILVA